MVQNHMSEQVHSQVEIEKFEIPLSYDQVKQLENYIFVLLNIDQSSLAGDQNHTVINPKAAKTIIENFDYNKLAKDFAGNTGPILDISLTDFIDTIYTVDENIGLIVNEQPDANKAILNDPILLALEKEKQTFEQDLPQQTMMTNDEIKQYERACDFAIKAQRLVVIYINSY